MTPGLTTLAASTNGVDFTNHLDLEIFQQFTVDGLSPQIAPRVGGTLVKVHGTGFTDKGSVLCQFGNLSAIAQVESSTTIVCAAPPSMMGVAESVPFAVLQHDDFEPGVF